MLEKSLKESIENCSILMQQQFDEILPFEFPDSRIVDAMRYSTLSGGKRIRPFLLMACANIFDISIDASMNAATAIELVHTYSLIHDDLPAMDNDDFRRGNPSNHKKFNEATAILAGDALLTYAFEILSDEKTHKNPAIRCELIKALAHSSGFKGMIGGQMIDLESSNKTLTKAQIANLHRQKTGELFMASCEMGAILGDAPSEERKKLRYYAHNLGLAFQIRDDILDHNDSENQKINIDAITHESSQDNISIVNVVGLETANQQLDLLISQAKEHVSYFGNKADLLIQLADFVKERRT